MAIITYKHHIMTFLKQSILILSLNILTFSCTPNETSEHHIKSPSENISISFFVDDTGIPSYIVKHKETTVIDSSTLGFDFKDQPSIAKGLNVTGAYTNTFTETWEMPWGEQRTVENEYNELILNLEETQSPNRKLNMYFKAYDNGIAFRYEFLKQENVDSITIVDENTQFKLTADHKVWWIPGDWDIYEHLYNTTNFSEIDALVKQKDPNLNATHIPQNAVNTPVTMKTKDGLYLSFHEANLTDYAGMTLKVDPENLSMTSELVGSDIHNHKVKRALPFKTPWRTIQIAEKAGDLIESKLILNLNEPNKIGDVSYFQPKKYVGIWWEMHIGTATWDMEGSQDMNTFTNKEKSSKKHGATTENAKKYIDFASKNGITGLLVEGWNTGWDKWINTDDREGVFDFMTPYPDYNFREVVDYAKEKNVEIIMHHETSAAPRTYEKQMNEAYDFMKENGMNSVKTGYVGKIIPKGEYHHGQWMVNHYQYVLEEAAKKKIAVNAHEPIKATGKRRTYPNAISREGLRGQEFNAWASDGGNPPEHLPIVAFTRMLAGPIDFTPGVFDIAIPSKPDNQVNTTLVQQLALYVVIYSPIQMACDLPENYEGHPALQFIRDVGVDWEQTIVLGGEIGDFVTIAREERDSGNWFIGSITDENSRNISIDFSFLDPDKTYEAAIYKDGEDAHYKNNPTSYVIENVDVNHTTKMDFKMVEGGGLAISLLVKE